MTDVGTLVLRTTLLNKQSLKPVNLLYKSHSIFLYSLKYKSLVLINWKPEL